ncbi:MAG: nicotinate-nucleotide adenylyltransferase [Clostridia bacterium]|nr:nicotinate-nucleotide adenylyltransferase [Clostridia bacterium]
MRIGILGGSFNPIHFGHLQLAQWTLNEYGLDEIMLVTASQPPHKEIAQSVSGEMRFEMVRRAVQDINNISASDIELERDGVSYTVDTLRQIKCEHKDAELFLVIGEDMLFSLPTWRDIEEIVKIAKIIVYARPRVDGNEKDEAKRLAKEYNANIYVGTFTGLDISSTMIREAVHEAKPISSLVPKCIEEYIYENGLYLPDEIKKIQADIKRTVKSKRYRHIMGTVRWAIELADKHKMDTKQARMAALLHDCAKFAPEEQMAEAKRLGIEPTPIEQASPALLHARLGAVYAKEKYGVDDDEIMEAIRCHTLCRLGMTRLDKLLYIADKTEPLRSFPGVNTLRKKAWEDLDIGTVACMDYSIAHTRNSGKQLDDTILSAREEILKKITGGKRK